MHADRPQLTEKSRILYVEDNPDNQRLMKMFLGKRGFQVTIAENGLEGNDMAIRAWRHGQPFDLIIMDMQMPVLDGYHATQRLRQQGYPHPIMAFTAHAMSEDRQRCLNCGCDAYESKPLDRQRMMESIEGLLLPNSNGVKSAKLA